MKFVKGLIFFTSLILLFFFLVAFLLSSLKSKKLQTEIISPVIETVKSSEKKILSLFTKKLDEIVSSHLKGTKGSYALVIKNMKTGETYSLNPDRQYPSASLYKLWTMVVVYDAIEKEKLEEDQVLSKNVTDLNDAFNIASDEAELTEGTITLSVRDALEKMITLSDNYAALLLTQKVGVSSLRKFLAQHDMRASQTGSPPVTTANDIALFFEKLYKKEFVSPETSEEMLALLSQQTLNDRIPRFLPKSVNVAHKTGELGNNKHDAGIIFTEKGNYIFVMLTQTNNPKQAAEITARISKDVYDYFLSDD